jgi:PEGA domain
MKRLLIGILVVLVCVGCVQAMEEYYCGWIPVSCNPQTPSGDLYIYLMNMAYTDNIEYYVDDVKRTAPIEYPPWSSYEAYRITPVAPGKHVVRVVRPGYEPYLFIVNICNCNASFANVLLVAKPTTAAVGIGNTIKPGTAGLVTTTTAAPGSFSSQLKAPTIAVKTTTTAIIQGSGLNTGGSGSQNSGTGATGSGQTGSTQSGSSQTGSQPGSANAGSTDTANTGSLSVTTTPSGAFIFIDGVMRGASPATIPGLSTGSHTLLLKLDGYQDLSTPVIIAAGKTQDYSTSLVKNAATTETMSAQATPKKSASPGFWAVLGIAILGAVLCMRRQKTE